MKANNRGLSKVLALIILGSILILSLGACQAGAATVASTTIATTAAVTTASTTVVTTAAAGAYPVTVKDAAGKSVTIQSAPKAIVASNVWSGEILLDLVDASRIAALSAWGDDPVLSPAVDKAKAVAKRITTTKAEEIVALKPDLVIIDTFSDVDGSLTRTLTEAGIVVLQLASPTDFTMISQTITTLAQATGEVEKGAAMVAAMQATLDGVARKVAAVPAAQRLKTMYYEDYFDATGKSAGMLCAYGAGSPFAAIAAAAGLVNVVNAPNYSAVSKEKVVGEWQPQLLVVPAMVFDANYKGVDDQGATIIKAIKADPLLKSLPAVKNNKIYALADKYRGSTSQYMAQAVVDLAQAAYPDLFK
jgi:iron complex transport system substrate-binding protein